MKTSTRISPCTTEVSQHWLLFACPRSWRCSCPGVAPPAQRMAGTEHRSPRRWVGLIPAFKQETANLVKKKKITRQLLVYFSFQLTASPPTAPSRCVLGSGQGWEVRCRPRTGQPASPLPGAQQPFTRVQGLLCKAAQRQGYQRAREPPRRLCRAPDPASRRQPKGAAGTHGWCLRCGGGHGGVGGPGSHPAHPEAEQHRLCPHPTKILFSLFAIKGLPHPCLRILLEDEIQYRIKSRKSVILI